MCYQRLYKLSEKLSYTTMVVLPPVTTVSTYLYTPIMSDPISSTSKRITYNADEMMKVLNNISVEDCRGLAFRGIDGTEIRAFGAISTVAASYYHSLHSRPVQYTLKDKKE